jgi:hypothetical protein
MRVIALNGPVIYTALYVMFLVRAIRGQVGGGWALEIKTFLGPVKWHQAVLWVPFGAQKSQDFQGPTSSHLPVIDLPASKIVQYRAVSIRGP